LLSVHHPNLISASTMKNVLNSDSSCLKARVLFVSLVVLLSGLILLAALGSLSKAFGARIESPQGGQSDARMLSVKNGVASSVGPAHRLDQHGNRPHAMSFLPLHWGNPRALRPAGNGNWFSLGPPGGDVSDAAVSTADPNVALAGIAPEGGVGGTLYRSTDAGNTWSEVLPLNGISVFDIEFAPNGAVYIGTQNSVRRSTDAGISWTLLNLGIGPNDQVFDVALDPSNSSTIWAGIADAGGSQTVNVMRSTDSGATWSDRTPPLSAPMSCRAIAVDPDDSSTVIAVFGGDFGGGQVWTTTDGGDSWSDRSAGLPDNPMQAVVYDGTRLLVGGGQLFGSENVGLYGSTDLGATWAPLHDGTWPVLVVDAIAVDPNNAQNILVATDGGGVNRTTDGGGSWQIGIGGSADLAGRSLRFRPASSIELLLGTASLAVFHSTDGGDHFVQSSNGISELNLFSIAASPIASNELAVAFQGQNNGGVLSSSNSGATWNRESAPPTRYSEVRFAPDGKLYAISTGPSTVAQEGLYRREDDGSWTPLGPDQGPLYESDLNTMRFSRNDSNLILLGGSDFGVAGFEATIWRSTDAGHTWTKVYEVGDFHRVTDIEIIEDGTDENMVAVWDSESGDNIGGALRSTDRGATWFDSSAGLPAFFLNPRLCASPTNPQSLIVSASLSLQSGGLFRTTEAGATWAPTGWTGSNMLGDVACSPLDDQMLFVTQLSGNPVLRSEDGGTSFAPFSNGLENVVAPRELAFAGDSRLLLASAKGSYGTDLAAPTPTPTPTPSSTATPTASPTPRATPTPRARPTPRTRPGD
jgi:photosystem II stability/assembly factor-like uncharacterized protein